VQHRLRTRTCKWFEDETGDATGGLQVRCLPPRSA
jgi:hypothetical protein